MLAVCCPQTLSQTSTRQGKPSPKNTQVIVPFLINGQEQGQVLIQLLSDNRFTFQGKTVFDALASVVIEEVKQKLAVALDKNQDLTLEDLNNTGLNAIFDPRCLELSITIPPEKRNKTTVTLYGEGVPPEAATALPPSNLSGYVNIQAIAKLPWSGDGGVFSNPDFSR